jgi:hypothetical protein
LCVSSASQASTTSPRSCPSRRVLARLSCPVLCFCVFCVSFWPIKVEDGNKGVVRCRGRTSRFSSPSPLPPRATCRRLPGVPVGLRIPEQAKLGSRHNPRDNSALALCARDKGAQTSSRGVAACLHGHEPQTRARSSSSRQRYKIFVEEGGPSGRELGHTWTHAAHTQLHIGTRSCRCEFLHSPPPPGCINTGALQKIAACHKTGASRFRCLTP